MCWDCSNPTVPDIIPLSCCLSVSPFFVSFLLSFVSLTLLSHYSSIFFHSFTLSSFCLILSPVSLTHFSLFFCFSSGLLGLFDSPNLCGIFPGEEPVQLNEGRHRVFLSLTEQGVEAAAASSLSFSRSFNTFSAMQPFVFIIWSEKTAIPLFMGRVIHPFGKE